MKHPNQYDGKNPIPGPKPFGLPKADASKAKTIAAKGDAPPTVPEAGAASVAITSLEAKPQIEVDPDANVRTQSVVAPAVAPPDASPATAVDAAACAAGPLAGAETKVDALANVKSGAQILADTSKAPASKRRKS